jgi:TRAP-type mannitol/chloroaromatic compound transport system permease small subunit
MRYLFNKPTFWGHETSQFLFGGYAVLVGAYALRHRAHVTVDVFYIHWSPRLQAIVDSFTWLMFWLFCGVLLWHSGIGGIEATLSLDHTNTSWGPPVWPLKLTIPIGALLLSLQGLSIYLRRVYFAITGSELAPEPQTARGSAGE